jgi:energy-coupling factor transporter ATP-binding protein EcfA2
MRVPKPVQALFKWTPSGVGLYFTAHYLLNQSVVQTAIAAFFTGVTTLWVKFSDGFMQEAEQQAEKLGGSFAQWIFALLGTLGAALRKRVIQVWWEITSDFEGKYYERLQYVCRRFQTQGLEADRDRVLNLTQVFVPVQICQRSLSRTSPNLLRRLEAREEPLRSKDIGDFLALMAKEPDFRRLAILGAPGSGKTTMMRYLTLMYAQRTPRQLHPQAPQYIPVLLYLRDIHPDILANPDITLADLITTWAKNLQKTDPLKPPMGWFAKQLKRNRCLILLDGLDEVANERDRQQISRWVDRQMYEYPQTPFILTSRPLGYESAQLQEEVMVLEVEPMTTEQSQQFIRNWYLAMEAGSQGGAVDLGIREEAAQQANRLISEIQQQSALAEMARNPLLLTMIATVHRRRATLPLNRVELYREICQVLLEKRQRAKGMVNKLTADQKQSVLQPLALDLTCRKTLKFTLDEVRHLLTQKLAALANVDWTPEQFMRHLRDVDALIAKEQEDVFEFAHRSFQEYLAATEIKDDKRRESLLTEALQAPENLEWWADTMRLYAAQTDTSQIIAAALKQPTLETLLLAIDFWQTGLTLQDQTVKAALFAQLNQPLEVLDEPTQAWAQQAQPRYFKLAYCLQQQRWREADIETYWVMVAAGDRAQKGHLSLDDIRQFPCEDLRVIDQLWVRYSQGIWGFSIQKQIYADCGATLDGNYPGDDIWDAFCDRVGWRKGNSYVNYFDLTFDLSILWLVNFLFLGLGAFGGGVGVGMISSLASRLVNCSK